LLVREEDPMIRVVHLFDIKKGVVEREFIEWLDGQLDSAARRFGCVDRKTWVLLDGFTGSYLSQKVVKKRPKYVNEAHWTDQVSPDRFREWLTSDPEGKDFHDKWFKSIENHTVLRYVEGWTPIPMES
jgi:hypothetical protein